MFDLVWNIKLKTNSMIKELQWYYQVKKSNLEGYKELVILFPKVFLTYTMAIGMDIMKLVTFIKSIFLQRIIFLPLVILLFLLSYYLFIVAGKPDSKYFKEKVFPSFYYGSAIEIRDQKGRLTGSMAHPQNFTANPSLFIEDTPDFFWSLIKERYDTTLDFNNSATSFPEALFQNPFYFNGVDILEPFIESKNLVVRAVSEGDLSIKSNPTLTQQLVTAYLKRYQVEPLNNIEKLGQNKTFYHKLRNDNGANFKRWLFTQRSLFFIENRGYGLRDTSEIFFGKSLDRLTFAQEAILASMYAYPYQLDSSETEQLQQWKQIKKEAIRMVENSNATQERYRIVSRIEKFSKPKLPYFPDSLMELVGKITPENQEAFMTLPTRSQKLLGTTKAVISEELNMLFRRYSITPETKLVTKTHINFQLSDNFYFNRYMNKVLENENLPNIWISIVNERGEFIRLYQQNSTYQSIPPIGNLGKVFTALLFADRGDKYYTTYCNKSIEEEYYEKGNSRCQESAWVNALQLFSKPIQLPLYDGFVKYRQNGKQGIQTHYTPIYTNKIEILYQNLKLQTLQNNEPHQDLGLGKLQMTPLEFHVSLHKVTQLLYRPKSIFYDAKLIKAFDYHDINNSQVQNPLKHLSLHTPSAISNDFKKFFTPEKRVTLKTLLKAPIYRRYGTLKWMKNYIGIKFEFAQESHMNNVHWLTGAFKKSGKYYSFVIQLQNKELSKHEINRIIQKSLESTLQSINNPHKMKYQYMKHVFGD